MSKPLRLNLKEANDLVAQIEVGGGNADGLRAAINDVKKPGNGTTSVTDGSLSDEEHIQWLLAQSPIEHGEGLECLVCHQKFNQLVSGTCEVCFREWALATKRR